MWDKRNNLSSEVLGIQTPSKTPIVLNYEKLIQNQQEVIKQLQKEISCLRQYFFYVSDLSDSFANTKHDISTSTDLISSISSEKVSKKIISLKNLILEIMDTLHASTPEEIIPNLTKLDEKANRKIEPVFIERVKEKEVPIIIEKIKEVEKAVVIQNMVGEKNEIRKGGENKQEQRMEIENKEQKRKKRNTGYRERQEKRYWKKEKEEKQKKYVEKKQ